jgi:hypothetical protein
MENSADSSGRNWLQPGEATAIGLGIVLGSVIRELPIAVSSSIWLRTNGSRHCDGAALDCAVAAVPDVIGELVVFGLLVISVALVFAAGGTVLVVHGLRRGKPAGIEARGVVHEDSVGRPVVGFAQVVVGTALAVPAVWLLASFMQSL